MPIKSIQNIHLLILKWVKYREGGRDKIDRERERESHRALPYRVCALVENLREISQAEK